MKVCTRVVLSLTVVCLALSTLTFAADDAYLFIVHGIPGRDVAASLDPTLPVDVLLNDDVCAERGITFGTTVGPLALPPGQYDLKISPANVFVPCGNEPLAETNVAAEAGRNVTAIAALDGNGKPTVLTFANDFTSVAENQSRIVLSNTADAPEVQITLQVVNGNEKYTYNVSRGKKVVATLPANAYTIQVAANGTVAIPAEPLTLPSVSATLIYTVGRSSNGSLQLVTKTVKDVL